MTDRIDELERRIGIMESDSHRGANAKLRGFTLGLYSVLLELDLQGVLPLATAREAVVRARDRFDPDIGSRERSGLVVLIRFMDEELQRRATLSPEDLRARWRVLPGGAETPPARNPDADDEDE